MKKYKARLLFGLMFLIFSVLIGLGVLLGQLFKEYYIQAYDTRLSKEGSLVTNLLIEEGDIRQFDQERLMHMSEWLESRISIVNVNGEIIFDSGDLFHENIDQQEDFILQILKKSDKNNEELLRLNGNYYYSYESPIKLDGQIQGYLVLSTRLTEVEDAFKEIWGILVLCLGLALIVIIFIGARITTRYTKPIESATEVAYELAKGNYRARTYEDPDVETGMLSTSINILARNLQSMVRANEIQQDRLTALIENMGSGMLLINEKGIVSLVNGTFKELFLIKDEDCLNKFYYEVIEHKEVSEFIEQIFMTEKKSKKQMLLPISIERKYFEVYGVPILGKGEEWKGILLVFHDITELKQLEQVRKDFVANVSHELKTPITSIKGFTETLLDGAKNDRRILDEFLTIILKESDRMQSLIFDLLELSKLERHEFKLSIVPINIVSLLEGVLKMVEKRAEEKDIYIEMVAQVDKIIVEGDEDRLKQVFLNLIVNAITYTPIGGTVKISAQENEGTVLITVADSGIGIEKNEIPRIFERFYRVDKARSRNSGGTGLGLAIVKHLVEAHYGTINVNSFVGKGSEFMIQLPKKFVEKKSKPV